MSSAEEEERWYFRDLEGRIQGPYERSAMRRWYMQSFLSADLYVSNKRESEFLALKVYYPKTEDAFLSAPVPFNPDTSPRWYFQDLQRKIQGPFCSREMREWYLAGYFQPDLRVCDVSLPSEGYGWQMIQDYFPNCANETPFIEVEKADDNKSKGSNSKELKTDKNRDTRYDFPAFFPAPPQFQRIKKIYPSEHPGMAKPLQTTDIFGNPV